jgi:exopolysaccharide biosynthesis polyprenyl glycosylphosphotransferase
MRLTASLPFMAVLVGAFAAGSLVTAPADAILVGALAALIVASFTRLLFELIIGFGRGLRRVVAAVMSSLAGCGLMALAGAVGAWPIDLAWLSASAGVTTVVLYLAAYARTVEIRRGAVNRRIFLVASAQSAADVAHEVARRGDLALVGQLLVEHLGPTESITDRLVAEVRAANPTVLVMSRDATHDTRLVQSAAQLHGRGLRVRTLQEYYERVFAKVPLAELTEEWFLFDIADIHRPRLYGVIKRAAEAVIAGLLLVLAASVMLACALAVRLTSGAPVLFRQLRVGRDGKPIEVIKFRTMSLTDVAGGAWAGSELHRITRLGRHLRRYRLDELPQLWNVLRGDLSLVGPRPEQPAIAQRLNESIPFYMTRYKVRPGLTGWAQVHAGYAGSEAGTLEKLQYDLFYLKRQGFRLDLLVLMATVRTVLAGRGE